MECPDCRHENPAGSRFCNECGARLPEGCPNCGHVNPEGAKFCNECGAALLAAADQAAGKASPAVEKKPPPGEAGPRTGTQSSNLQTLIPDEFAAKLAAARAQQVMVGERRVVTMLFCDLKGSTAAAGTLDPEEWAQIMNGIFEYMIRPVYKYEGTVARLMGDAILAFFGAPVAHEDDPQRAIMAALDIINEFKPYQQKIVEKWGLEMNFRIGINTGLVMVGTVGSDLQMEYTALGDAINLAARMEQTAEPGTIQVAEETHRLAEPVFEWEALGKIDVKGKGEPVQTYRPLRRKSAPGRLRGIAGLDAPMVGREQESEIIQESIRHLTAGVGGIIFITGEAGLGKSRLIRELKIGNQKSKTKERKAPDETGKRGTEDQNAKTATTEQRSSIVWSETASHSYETTQPYALFQRLLRHVYGVGEGDSALEMWEKFAPILEQFPPDMEDHGRVFEALFATSGPSGDDAPAGEQFKKHLFDLMTQLVESWTSSSPNVIVLDDLHWSDPASAELLIHLFRLTETQPLLLICAMRPERSTKAWEAMELARRDYAHRTTEITLKALTATDTDALVDHLLVVSDLPAPLRKRILEKTEGNPFFIEEVVRVLIEGGMVERHEGPDGVTWHARRELEDIDIPGNLQSLLIARIDRLEDDARRTLQLASVIGRSFYYRILDSISGAVSALHPELDAQLRKLERAEMIRESARVPELEYAFRHALTQEAAYNTILLRERQAYHRKVGKAVEEIFADRLEDFYALLAHHYGEARDPRAIHYEGLAGDAALRLYAIPEAISHYKNAVSLLNHADPSIDQAIHLYERLGRCYELLSEHETAIRTYQEMAAYGEALGNPQVELAARVSLGKVYAIPTPVQDVEQAREHSNKGLEIAARLEDGEAKSSLLWNAMLIEMYSGHMDRAIPFGEQSAALARSTNMHTQLAHSLNDLGLPYMAVGDLAKSREVLDEAFEIWKTLNNKPMQAENRSNRGIERTMSGSFEEAKALIHESFKIADEIDNDWGRINAMTFAPIAHLALGEISTAMEIHGTHLPLAHRIGHPGSTLILVSQAQTYMFLGAHELALETAGGAVWDSEEFPPFHQLALALQARYLHRSGDEAGTQEFLARAKLLSDQKTIIHIDIEAAFAEIEILSSAGDYKMAESILEEMLALIDRAGARYYLPEAKQLLAKIRIAEGRRKEAAGLLEEAADSARETQHRTSLLSTIAMQISLAERITGKPDDSLVAEARELVQFIAGKIPDPALKQSFLEQYNYRETL